jgi:AcrR family transcriptional regulator
VVAVAARYGYGGTSVARVVRQAGVSRATFYEHFADRDDCFLAAHRQVAQGIEDSFGHGLGRHPEEILGELLAWADRDPARARLGLIEGLAGDAAIRRQHEELMATLEQAIERHLSEPPAGSRRLLIPARAVLGGVAGVVAIRVFRGEAGRLSELRDDLVTWIESYAVPASAVSGLRTTADWRALGAGLVAADAESLGPEVLERRLPRGRGALPPAIVAGEQRERLLAAVAELGREKGYTATTVADLVARAGVTREVFYEQFRGKEDAFLATQAFGIETCVSLTAAGFFNEGSWPDRIWNGLEAALRYVAGQRSLAYVDLVESYAAGAAAIRRSFENRMAYTLFLEEGYRQRPEAAERPRLTSEVISGAIQELCRRQVVLGQGERILELLPQVVYLTLAPFIGPQPALELVESKVRKPRRRSRESPEPG